MKYLVPLCVAGAALVWCATSLAQDSDPRQKIDAMKRQLVLPKDTTLPAAPRSDKGVFRAVPEDGTRLEVLLRKDGTVYAFEKLTVGDVREGTTHATTYEDEAAICGLLKLAADNIERKVLVPENEDFRVADVDLVLFAAPETPLHHFLRLVQNGCRRDISIYRYHLRVQDAETGKVGFLPYHVPCLLVAEGDETERTFLANNYGVSLFDGPDGVHYEVKVPAGVKPTPVLRSLESVGRFVDGVKKENPQATFSVALGVVTTKDGVKPVATVQTWVDFLTLMGTKGADLKCLKLRGGH